ncbi:hypothetical protein L873DRAFT_354063 [Choiromyces venosus 120613-1]|uniref:Uncharacterized protein n=1 Tax=Choiromyces venosus 120613-1 TaxID=1336337 RepID=A0A3N4IYE0_9PEZI|nr:hypothetical protein L873DRAFT_354063 [Choiromyces venosus 120613-1]
MPPPPDILRESSPNFPLVEPFLAGTSDTFTVPRTLNLPNYTAHRSLSSFRLQYASHLTSTVVHESSPGLTIHKVPITVLYRKPTIKRISRKTTFIPRNPQSYSHFYYYYHYPTTQHFKPLCKSPPSPANPNTFQSPPPLLLQIPPLRLFPRPPPRRLPLPLPRFTPPLALVIEGHRLVLVYRHFFFLLFHVLLLLFLRF